MEQLNHIISTIALSMGLAWASGINLYATILVLGLLGAMGHMALPPDLQILAHPMVIAAAGLMYLIEFVTDKIPGVDTGWDALHTFIRIPAGAVPVAALVAALLGGFLAAGTHVTKAGTRVLINTSPEPVSNWIASVLEDVTVIVGMWTALYHPWLFLVLLIAFILLLIWILPRIWRGIKKVFSIIASFISGKKAGTPADQGQ
jgi:hypothetical protein